MRQRQTIDENRKMLLRVAAVLVSLAGLLERARVASFLLVWLLRPGEAAAWAKLEALAPGAFVRPVPDAQAPAGPAAEARRLAASFRALAVAVASLAEAWPDDSAPAPAPARRSSPHRMLATPPHPAGRFDSS